MTWTLHRRHSHPLSWELRIDTWEWALPLRVKIRPQLIDGSGRREHVTNIRMGLLCLHWSVYYAWGRRRYRRTPELIRPFSEVMKQDQATPLTPE